MGRMEKVNEMMKREISEVLRTEVQDPRVSFVTITSVNVSPDLHLARVNYSVLGGQAQAASGVQEALESASGYVRRIIGQRITLRYTPKIEFMYDDSIEYSARIHQALEDIKRDAPEEKQAKPKQRRVE